MSTNEIMDVDEIVSYLDHSDLLNILVEGKDDIFIYSLIQEFIGSTWVSFLPCGGRIPLLQVYKRRDEFPNARVMFIADKDMYVFTGIPPEYSGVLFTAGYSIENDLYSGSKEFINRYLNEQERSKKEEILKNVIEWFAFEVELYHKGQSHNLHFSEFNLKDERIMPEYETYLTEGFLTKRNYHPAQASTIEEISRDYSLKLRGKYIIEIFAKIFQERIKSDKAKPKQERNKYSILSTDALLHTCFLKSTEDLSVDNCTTRIINEIRSFFSL